MRNGVPVAQQPLQLNESIERTREMMRQIKNSQNPQMALAQMLQNNPNSGYIASLLRNNGNLEGIARQMAQSYGIDFNQLIQSLQQGI